MSEPIASKLGPDALLPDDVLRTVAGGMVGDFTTQSFDPRKNFSAVPVQQGRPQLDADFLHSQVAMRMARPAP